MALSLVPSIAHAYDFSAVNGHGMTIYYNILNEEEKLCEVTYKTRPVVESYPNYLTISIPEYANEYKVIAIGENAFYQCSRLKTIEIPKTVEIIGNEAFAFCKSLKSLTIPKSVWSIGKKTFSYCSDLNEIILPVSLTDIGDEAFSNCEALAAIKIPSSVATIGKNPFHSCKSLSSISVEEDNPYYNSSNNCNAIIETSTGTIIAGCKNTAIPETADIIGDWAFYNCSALTSISIPKSVKEIGEMAFIFCDNLESVTIPASLASIRNYAFRNCPKLKTITCHVKEPFDIDTSVFEKSNDITLYVPYTCSEAYKSIEGWRVISNIVEMDPPTIPMLISCNSKGSISINNNRSLTNSIGSVEVYDGYATTFTFTPKPGCKIDQVILNGLDITANVQNSTLTCTIPANSQMIVTFTTEQGDMNNDGIIDISDVVSIVNKILGN